MVVFKKLIAKLIVTRTTLVPKRLLKGEYNDTETKWAQGALMLCLFSSYMSGPVFIFMYVCVCMCVFVCTCVHDEIHACICFVCASLHVDPCSIHTSEPGCLFSFQHWIMTVSVFFLRLFTQNVPDFNPPKKTKKQDLCHFNWHLVFSEGVKEWQSLLMCEMEC